MTLLNRLQADAVAKFETQIRVQYINQTDLENVITNTVTAVLDEIENEARDLYLESDDENYQRALTDIKAIIGNLKRTEV